MYDAGRRGRPSRRPGRIASGAVVLISDGNDTVPGVANEVKQLIRESDVMGIMPSVDGNRDAFGSADDARAVPPPYRAVPGEPPARGQGGVILPELPQSSGLPQAQGAGTVPRAMNAST